MTLATAPVRRSWRGPAYPDDFPTLGWQVLEWASVLPSPADETQPLVYTDEQARLLLRWYELDPDTGEFVHRRCRLEMAKGWGKSPFAGSVALAELVGPVCFDGWDANGEPVGVPWGTGERPAPWVQVAAVSEDQTDNTYAAMYEMLVANDHRAATALGIDQGRTRLFLRNRPGRLEPVTASAGSREGQRVTFGLLDETHLWRPTNGGVKLAATIRRNAAKMGGRTLETTNAPVLGERSVAEEATDGEAGVLHYARRPPVEPAPDWPSERLRVALVETYGDARWAPIDRFLAEIADPATDWDDALRFYFNIRSAGLGRAVDPRLWDALAKPRDVPLGTRIGLGFDGSISQDATVLRGCTADGYSFALGSWVRPHDAGPDWQVPRAQVHQAVAEAFARYSVGLMLCDPPKWWTEIQGWALQYGEEIVVALDTNQERRFAPAVDRWRTALAEGTHTHDADPLTDAHVKAAHLRKVRAQAPDEDGRTRYVIVKGDDRRRIDAAVADILCHEAAMTMRPAPALPEPMVAWA